MPSAHMQHVVSHVGAGDIVRDHLHAVGAVCAGSTCDVLAADGGGRSDGIRIRGIKLSGGRDGLLGRSPRPAQNGGSATCPRRAIRVGVKEANPD